MSTTNQYLINIKRIADGRDFGDWRTLTGWGSDSAEVFSRDVYGGPRRSLGAPKTLDTVTASKTFYADLDDDVSAIDESVGNGEKFLVLRQKLLPSGEVTGKQRTATCTLKSLKLADANPGDDSPEADSYTVELTPEG